MKSKFSKLSYQAPDTRVLVLECISPIAESYKHGEGSWSTGPNYDESNFFTDF